ncbi:MAG: PKD domain-containing protein [Bacteroidota bacterium]
MRFLLILLAVLLPAILFSSLSAQTSACGTVIDASNLQRLHVQNRAWQQARKGPQIRSSTSMNMVPIQLHIIRSSASSGGISSSDLLEALDRVNELFLDAQLHFYQCSAINYIDNDTYYSYDYSEMAALDAAHSVKNVINIYCSETTTAGNGAYNICGHAQFPGGLDFIMLNNDCAKNGSTFAHELGHYFNLYHTHETAFGAELVDGSDCSTDGDLVCDTPADPSLSVSSNLNSSGCIYTGTGTDTNGDSYSPDVTNLMSYTGKNCRYSITANQKTRILYTLQNSRTNLSCSSTISLDSDFEPSITSSCGNSLTVQFCDVSDGSPTSWSWDFGDGSGTSTDQHPSYTYSSTGVYDVRLTISKGSSSNAETISQLIKVGTVSVPYSENFEDGTSDLGQYLEISSMKNDAYISSIGAKSSSYGLVMEGYDGSSDPYFMTPTSATAFDAGWNPYFKSKLSLCVDAVNYKDLTLGFDMKQLHGFNSNYTNFRVLIDDTQIGSVYQADGTESWSTVSLDISSYDLSSFTLSFEASNKYNNSYNTSYGNATFLDNLAISGNPAVLPVEYEAFEAQQRNIDVHVRWTTIWELNNDLFEVMRSNDSENWEKVGIVMGAGSVDQPSSYQFWDRKAATLPVSSLYYQIRQKDVAGQVQLSQIKEVKIAPIHELKIFPNPTSGKVQIIVPNQGNQVVKLQVLDQMGKVYQSQTLSVQQAAFNNLYHFDLQAFPRGSYIIRLTTGTTSKSKLVLLK